MVQETIQNLSQDPTTISNLTKTISETCRIVEEGNFLKRVCSGLHGDYYICQNSTDKYNLVEVEHTYTIFSHVCRNDPLFYQACGHTSFNSDHLDGRSLCGNFVCETQGKVFNGSRHTALTCNRRSDCLNTNVDEDLCEDVDLEMFHCDNSTEYTNISVDQYDLYTLHKTDKNRKVNPEKIRSDQVCNGECDCLNCRDESNCTGNLIGLYCEQESNPNSLTYLHPSFICDSSKDCLSGIDEEDCGLTCTKTSIIWSNPPSVINVTRILTHAQICDVKKECSDGKEEMYCMENPPYYETCVIRKDTQISEIVRALNDKNKCSVTKERKGLLTKNQVICEDGYRNFLNCTHKQAALDCTVDGFPTTLSENVMCSGRTICDDGMDNNCIDLGWGCKVHKHKLCDNITDCVNGRDEDQDTCSLTQHRTCIRRYPASREESLRFPVYWIGDGETDCIDDSDEEVEDWKECDEEGFSYTEEGLDCLDYYNCGPDDNEMIPLAYLCDRINSCGNENEVCEISRDMVEVWTEVQRDKENIRLVHCLPGVHYSNEEACLNSPYFHPDVIFGESPLLLTHPKHQLDCTVLYGALYVYAVCSGRCINTSILCPLTPVSHDSCKDLYPDRKFTVASAPEGSPYLTFVEKTEDEHYQTPELFVCPDGHCIYYDQVCDLAEDCLDGSDEKFCANSYKCNSSHTYIPISSYCDGKIDCEDLSDECNDQCSAQIIKGGFLSVYAWIIGVLAVLMNVLAIIRSIFELSKTDSCIKVVNLVLILQIAVGDLGLGVYLIWISHVDTAYKHYSALDTRSYCKDRFNWLTGQSCLTLGIISTLSSLLSLYSMTILSVFRVICVQNPAIGGKITLKARLLTATISLLVLTTSIVLAVLPVLPNFEDTFVNGLTYTDNPMFIGSPNKQQHIQIIDRYYKTSHKTGSMSWRMIRRLVSSMFFRYEGKIEGQKLNFYGNDGVCLFKYFVRENDPQRFFSLAIVANNSVCFMVIISCYLYISIATHLSSQRVNQGARRKSSSRNTVLNRKITIMITTDTICWIPFIILIALHYTRIMDATDWYALSSIIILPLNAIINPLLYDNVAVVRAVQQVFSRVRETVFSETGNVQEQEMCAIRQRRVFVNKDECSAL